MSKNFVLIGAAGYVAPRYMAAIKATGNRLLAAFDPFDSVGIIDSYFPDADFFTEFERFDRHLEKLKRQGTAIDYVSICSPNYLHDAHIRFGLRIGASVICEKPLVLNPWNLEALAELEQEYSGNIYTILQLRLHPSVQAFKRHVDTADSAQHYQIKLDYVTSRGRWYHYSWKGNEQKSGGIATNIGIHFFDMLQWIFGSVKENKVLEYSTSKARGCLEFEQATVQWLLSIDANDLPEKVKVEGGRTYRSLRLDEEEVEFSQGFTDLHIASYEKVLKGEGFEIQTSSPAIDIIHKIRVDGKNKS